MSNKLATYGLTPEDANKLSDFLHVRLRDFWLGMHPIIQAKLYMEANGPEEFFTLVDQEYARFEQGTRFQKPRENSWGKVIPIEYKQEFLTVVIPIIGGD